MIPEIGIIHQLATNDLYKINAVSESDLKAWIANGDYLHSKNLTPNSKQIANEFELNFQRPELIYSCIANDCNRFAQAAIESMFSVSKIDSLPKSSGWAAVQMYYSAFFAAHAILRIFGRACTQLESVHADKLLEIASLTGADNGATSIENGFYLSVLSGNTVDFRKLKDTHADTWHSFSVLLTWIIDNISHTTGLGKHKSDAISLISQIKKAIHSSGASKGNWLSQLRNKVNYQHTHGTWFPYRGALHDVDQVLRNAEWVRKPTDFNLNSYKNDIAALHGSSNLILSFMYSLLKYGFERSGSTSAPFKNGVFRLVNQLDVA